MVSLELVKQHLNITDDFDDAYIETLIEVAESAIETELNINLCDIPHASLSIARMSVCALVAAMYRDREAVSPNDLKTNYVYRYLKDMIKNYTLNAFG